jgi:hypothetical protein
MIIVFLTGGLGNQMFQYATARRLAEKHSTILKLDVTGFETYKLHRYSLPCFHVWEYLATQTEIDSFLRISKTPIKKILNRLKFNSIRYGILNKNIYEEKYFNFDPSILSIPNNSYLSGYWQSEKYFIGIEDIIRREFTIKYPQDTKSREISEIIQAKNSISIHIRRTDYINDLTTNKVHGICGLDYYQNCIDYITTKISNPYFFVFSDDPQWAKENLKVNFPVIIVDHNDASRNYEDLRLMSQCKHNIIANSSFSWWGAWLNINPERIVIAPQKWFNDMSRNTDDLIPQNWLKF